MSITNQPLPSGYAIRPIVPEPVFTDRKEHLDYLVQAALKAVDRRTTSIVLLGQRRMGKTEIFKRAVNRLFFGQEHYADMHRSVIPVFYNFRDNQTDKADFAIEYVENFLRWYAGFRLHDDVIPQQESLKNNALIDFIQSRVVLSDGIEEALRVLKMLLEKKDVLPEKSALWLPRRVSDRDDSTIAMFLDEFQNTRLPQYGFDVVGYMQEAVESPTCPHFVTGSAMSILAREILGRGSLFGRFESEPIQEMTPYWGTQLALKSAEYYGAVTTDVLAPVIAERCGGNPFYITAVIRQSAKQNRPLTDEAVLNEILAVDLSSGFIWGELSDQVSRWIARINEYHITKWVLYLSALEEGDKIDLDRIRRQILEKEGKDVSIEVIRDVLIKLSRGDLLDYMELGGWFRKVQDPILLEFLKVWGKVEVEGTPVSYVRDGLIERYQNIKRRIGDHIGYLAEIYMAQVLWNLQNKTVPGKYFHVDGDISIPWHFSYIQHRFRLGGGADMEIDVYAAAGSELWIAESKWWTNRTVGLNAVNVLNEKSERVRIFRGDGLKRLRVWFFSYSGFTAEAELVMKEKAMLWSTKQDMNDLLDYAGLRRLPEILENC
jgi:hypothetical protein